MTAEAGTPNTGGGGGGGGNFEEDGEVFHGRSGDGGSGVVILRVSDTVPEAVTTGSPNVSTSGNFRIYRFNASGTIKWDL